MVTPWQMLAMRVEPLPCEAGLCVGGLVGASCRPHFGANDHLLGSPGGTELYTLQFKEGAPTVRRSRLGERVAASTLSLRVRTVVPCGSARVAGWWAAQDFVLRHPEQLADDDSTARCLVVQGKTCPGKRACVRGHCSYIATICIHSLLLDPLLQCMKVETGQR